MTALPPGQYAVDGFPRFGTHFHRPPPPVPADPGIEITGAGIAPFTLPLAELGSLPRRELVADFHCVAGWTATDLRWEGLAFAPFYRSRIEPLLPAGRAVTHLVFEGLDGYRSVALLEDALADDVVIADRLDGRPLDADHGAPARLVSPQQYGFVSTKHLCRIELHERDPGEEFGSASALSRAGLRIPLFRRHPRSRVWHEERHRYLPARALRPVYRLITPPIRFLCARGARRRPPP